MQTTVTGRSEIHPAPRNVPVMAVSTGLNVGAYMLFGPILSLILRELGASDFEVSLASGLWLGVGAVFQFQGGRWGDQIGRRPVIVYPTFLIALTLAAAAWAPNWYIFTVLYLGYSIASAIQAPLFSAIVGESVAPATRGTAFGTIEFAIGFGVMLGPIIGSRLLPVIGNGGLLLAAGGGFALSGIMRYLLLTETRPANVDLTNFAFGRVFRGSLFYVLVAVVASQLVYSLTLWGPFLALYAKDALLLSKQQISLYYGVSAVVSTVMSLVAGRIVNRIGPFRTLGGSSVALAAAVLFWAFQRNLAAIICGYVAMGAFFQFAIVSMDAFRVVAVDEKIRGSALGAMGTVAGLVSAGVIPAVGYLQGQLGFRLPFWVAAAATGMLVISVWKLRRELEVTESGLTVHGFRGFS